MGRIEPRNRRRAVLAGAALLTLVLASCSSPTPAAPPSVPPPSSSAPAACGAVRDTVLSALAVPMAAATGRDAADVAQAREALAGIQGQVPAELKEPFDKLKTIADDAGRDFSTFNTGEFDKTLAPIHSWLEDHC